MKKKLLGSLVALVFVLMTGLCLTACGNTKKLKVSVAQFDDAGIAAVGLYTVKADKYSKDDENAMSAFYISGNCYDAYNGYQSVELDQGTYAGVVAIRLNDSHELGGGWMSANGYDVKVEVNGTQLELLPTSLLRPNPFGGYDYWAMVGDDGVFSGDLNIKLIGKTTIKTYAPTLTIKNYDEDSPSYSKYENLVFKVSKNGTTLTNAGKQEFNVNELKALLAEQSYTYYDEYDVVGYFKNKDRFFPSSGNVSLFGDGTISMNGENNELEFFWQHRYHNYSNNVKLDFAVFDEIALDDMTKVKFQNGLAGNGSNIFNTMFQNENIKFIVDGTEKTELTVSDYYQANSIKIKSIVSDLGALVLQDPSIIVTPAGSTYFDEGRQHKRLTQSEIIIGGAVADKPGYREVTFDFGNYKPFKEPNAYEYTILSLSIFDKVNLGNGVSTFKAYTDAVLAQLQHVEFVNSNTVDDGQVLHFWYDNENQIEDCDENYQVVGCYHMSDKPLEFALGRIGFSGSVTATLTMTITHTDGMTEDVNMVLDQDGTGPYWRLEEPNENITCEPVWMANWGGYYNKITLNNYNDVTKISAEMSGPTPIQNF